MQYYSTRGTAPRLSFEDTLLHGLADDGGLYLPCDIPQFSQADIADMRTLSYEECAFKITAPFIGDAYTAHTQQAMIERAYAQFSHSARAPLVQIGQNHFLQELFHGPTLAFKDFAMQLIAQMFKETLAKRDKHITIIGATSGDTGAAAIHAFKNLPNITVCILFPENKVSPIQRQQMTTSMGSNILALSVKGNFDDCQNLVKGMFQHHAFRTKVHMAGINSINWARIMAQIVYYFYGATRLGAPDVGVSFTVPTGNFGDIFAGHMARKMGLNIQNLVIATNQNDILHRCMQSGVYDMQNVTPSISPSMDIQMSSNFERLLLEALGYDHHALSALMRDIREKQRCVLPAPAHHWLCQHFASGRCSETDTYSAIQDFYRDTHNILCPHSAISAHVGRAFADHTTPMISLATAHPAKFSDAISKAIGSPPNIPPHIQALLDRDECVYSMPNDQTVIEDFILEKR